MRLTFLAWARMIILPTYHFSLSLSQEKLDQTEDKLASTEADVARLQMDLARVTAAEHSLRQEHSDAKIQHAELEADLRHKVRTRKE